MEERISKESVLTRLLNAGLIGIIRVSQRDKVIPIANAFCEGGIRAIEITLTIPGALELIRSLRSEFPPELLIGAGTVLSGEDAKNVIDAGAQFVVSPVYVEDTIRRCHEAGVVCIPGCSTATEIYQAWNFGADIVKLFPSKNLGPRYLREINGPLPEVKLMPTSVDIDDISAWISAGAVAVGIGRDLLDPDAIARGDYAHITKRAQLAVEKVREARSVH